MLGRPVVKWAMPVGSYVSHFEVAVATHESISQNFVVRYFLMQSKVTVAHV
jgi:hypothetical protein